MTPSSTPAVSTATCRFLPQTFSAASPRSSPRLAGGQAPPRGPPFRRLDALGVDDRGARARLLAVPLAQHHHEVVADALPHPRVREGPHVAVDRPPRRERG